MKKRRFIVQSVLFTIVLHVVVFGFLILSFDWTVPLPAPVSQVKPVEAVVVEESKVKEQMEKLRKLEDDKKKKEQARQQELDRKAREAEQKRQAEEKRIADLKKKRAEEEKKQKEEAARVEKLRQEKAALEKKKAEEAKRLAKLEAERKVEEDRKRKQEEAERKAREAELRKQLEAEERAAREAAAQNEINKYVDYIRQKVTQNWLKPIVNTRGLKCTVNVKLIPSGEVVGVTIVQGSGNALFDRSVESAVRKASPLPLPKDPALVNRMRDINFVFHPEA